MLALVKKYWGPFGSWNADCGLTLDLSLESQMCSSVRVTFNDNTCMTLQRG